MWKSILSVAALAGWVGTAYAEPVAPGAEPQSAPLSDPLAATAMDETPVFSVLVSAERVAASDMSYEISPLAVAAKMDDEVEVASTVSENDLGSIAGGDAVDDLQLSTATTTGIASNNSVGNNVQTGQIGTTNINGVSGFSTIMLNTGNNVVMQSTTQVNIILK